MEDLLLSPSKTHCNSAFQIIREIYKIANILNCKIFSSLQANSVTVGFPQPFISQVTPEFLLQLLICLFQTCPRNEITQGVVFVTLLSLGKVFSRLCKLYKLSALHPFSVTTFCLTDVWPRVYSSLGCSGCFCLLAITWGVLRKVQRQLIT